jgi:DNA replication initiation complex subunit (GINS family)
MRTVESSTHELKRMDDSYYVEVVEYLSVLEQKKGSADSYDEVYKIDNEIINARIAIKDIYTCRVHKFLDYASLTVSGTKLSIDVMTTKEKQIFTDVVKALTNGKEALLGPITKIR